MDTELLGKFGVIGGIAIGILAILRDKDNSQNTQNNDLVKHLMLSNNSKDDSLREIITEFKVMVSEFKKLDVRMSNIENQLNSK
ncbi:MAG: hypothetical protein ACRC6E_10510 [Fusobacteriaceae bacterium]